MIEFEYIAIPCDEPPPKYVVRHAQKEADNRGVFVCIKDTQGRVYAVYEPEV